MLNRPKLYIAAPVETVSGYGARARDLIRALIKMDKHDIKIIPTVWGATPPNALDPEKDKDIIERLIRTQQLPEQPDIWIQLTVPNEYQAVGKFNIGMTAGIETSLCSKEWIEGMNRMNLIITSSYHSKNVLANTTWKRQAPNGVEEVIKTNTPIEVLLEGVDLEKYFKTDNIIPSVNEQLKKVKEDWAFLFVGHWLPGNLGADRKNVGMLIKIFLETFKNKINKPALILKTTEVDFSYIDRDSIMKKIDFIRSTVSGGVGGSLPNIYLLHGDLTDEEMNSLYNHPKIKAHITFTFGEGYGRPLAEASLSVKPIIASNWSGHLDFLKHAILLPGKLVRVDPSVVWNPIIIAESEWFQVDYAYAGSVMKRVYEHHKDFEIDSKRQATFIKNNFSMTNMIEEFNDILEKYTPEFPSQMQLKLPTLKKIELPKLKTIANITNDEHNES